MDDLMVRDLEDRLAWEAARTGPPVGFPAMPDLPITRYLDKDMFDAEMRYVWRRSWLFAGHECEYPDKGSYKALDNPLAPIFLVRGADGKVRAFLNACRHRSAPVVRDDCGQARYLVCQYHSWAYDLAGKLVNVPDQRDFIGLDPRDRSLVELRCETWGGFIYINLDRDATPLLEWLAPLTSRFSEIMTADYRLVQKSSWELNCNWKLLPEAFLEFYHIPTVHKRSAAPFLDTQTTVMMMHPNGHGSGYLEYRINEMSQSAKEEFFARDEVGEQDVPQIVGASPFFSRANPALFSFPNLIASTDISGLPIITFWPLELGRTRMDLTFYGLDWGDRPRPQGWDLKLVTWDQLMREDIANLEPIYRSMKAALHTGIPLNYQERRIWHMHAEIDRLIGPGNIPPGLGIDADLLSDYIES